MRLLTSKLKCGSFYVPHYYLHPYLPLEAGRETMSQSLIRFKQRIQPDLDAWIGSATENLASLPFSTDTIILRALRHDETTARMDFPSALDILGQTIAHRFNCRYLPTMLTKKQPTLPSKYLTRRQRKTQLDDVFTLSGSATIPPATPFLLIDDILTTGSTMRALVRTLQVPFPVSSITAFTLARADYQMITPAKTV